MIKNKFVLMLGVVLLTSGCATKIIEKTITVKQNVYKAVAVSPELLTPCNKSSIFTKEEYINNDTDGRRKLLVDAVADRNEALDGCNRKIETIGNESKKLSDIVNKRKDAPEITETVREYKE